MASLRFDGKVAVITGAGGGLGRAYSLELSRRGASVVVNDLGCSHHGEGKGEHLADNVVREIQERGGIAVANYDSVDNGENIIATAINNFGRVDIVINNAGILRDRSFANMAEAEWDAIFQVHVKGAFKVTKAAWPYMRKQKYGRVVMTTSSSGLYGNFGQANYSAAKLALVGFANTLSIEGRKANINVNCIAPIAETRMTIDLMGNSGMMKIEHIVPFVLNLVHDSCSETGSIIETGGGFAAKVRLEKTSGVQLRQSVSDDLTAEKVAEKWSDFTTFTTPPTAGQPSMNILQTIQNLPETSPSEALVEKLKAHQTEAASFTYTEDDIIQYALSVGAQLPADFCHLYEGHSDFSIIPTFLVSKVIEHSMMSGAIANVPGMDQIDLSRVLHGEQYMEVLAPIPTSGTLTITTRYVDLLDKGKFCSLITENEISDEKGRKLMKTQSVSIFIGSGGVGRKGKSTEQISPVVPPKRLPEHIMEEKTTVNQAAMFRLSGDKNLIHIDPSMSSIMGFKKPILHGLCSFGYAARHVLKTYGHNKSDLLKSMKVQFSKPVIPGDTLMTEMWREGKRIVFQMKVKESGNVVLKGGFIDLLEVHEGSKL